MPNRWLRDPILASRTLADLSDFAERLFNPLAVGASIDRNTWVARLPN
jgi:hypothetical protein